MCVREGERLAVPPAVSNTMPRVRLSTCAEPYVSVSTHGLHDKTADVEMPTSLSPLSASFLMIPLLSVFIFLHFERLLVLH